MNAVMIYIGLGANLPGPGMRSARETLEAGLAALTTGSDIRLLALSRWYETAPVPVSDQPWYVNAVAAIATSLAPASLLERLHAVERQFGRVRGALNAARSLDLDIVDYDGRVEAGPPILPHPRLASRAFVLRPLADLDPAWRHPVSGLGLDALAAALPAGQDIRLLPE